ncbi:Mth938-like domain-containing protein [Candidatus Mesenet endosymbiont of Phosphuga atrata]|uniref:Mth938-like domain-containing protein n=1 Tax=Candidatus Mesenet endosymbiont of Phosphuga atrata TaxID=3066221 RepID=UPI0030CBA03D
MDITPIISDNKKIIDGYKEGCFIINNEEYKGSVIVFPERVVPFPELDINNMDHLLRFLNVETEVILVGTGAKHISPHLSVRDHIRKQSLSFEFMSTGAACRTYNVLLSEGRYVIAILMAI